MRHAYTGRMHTYTVPYTYEDGPEEIGTVEYLICVRGSAPTAPTLRTDPDDCDPGDPGELEILHVEEDAKDGKILSIEEFEKIVGVNAYDHVMKYIERNDNFWNTGD